MEVKDVNMNPRRSKGGDKITINNMYKVNQPFYPFVPAISQGTRALIEAMPYGKQTIPQEIVNIRNQDLSMGTRNQQMFGELITSPMLPGLPRN